MFDRGRIRIATWSIVVSAGALSAGSVLQQLRGDDGTAFLGFANVAVHQIAGTVDGLRSVGPYDDPNFFAQVLLLSLPLSIFLLFSAPVTAHRFIAGATTALTIGAVYFTYSRGALIGIAVVSAATAIARGARVARTVLTISAAALLIVLMLPSGYRDRITAIGSLPSSVAGGGQSDPSLAGRASEVTAGLRMFADHPLLGVGYGNYENHYMPYSKGMDLRREEREAHSLYVEVLAETGLLGAATFAGFVTWAFRSSWFSGSSAESRAHLGQAIAIGILAYLTTSLFLHAAFVRPFFIVIAMALSYAATTEPEPEPENTLCDPSPRTGAQ